MEQLRDLHNEDQDEDQTQPPPASEETGSNEAIVLRPPSGGAGLPPPPTRKQGGGRGKASSRSGAGNQDVGALIRQLQATQEAMQRRIDQLEQQVAESTRQPNSGRDENLAVVSDFLRQEGLEDEACI